MALDGLASEKLDAEDRRRNQMSAFEDLTESVESLKCLTCGGRGEYDDAEPGDIFFNVIRCNPCQGTGFRDGQARQLAAIPLGTKDPIRS